MMEAKPMSASKPALVRPGLPVFVVMAALLLYW
jgi:hypothetical protein